MNVRLALFQSLLKVFLNKNFFKNTLDKYNLNKKDYSLALEIGHGVIRNLLYLEHVSKSLFKKPLKGWREKIIVYISLYQLFFNSKIPKYAVVNESVFLAKKFCSLGFSKTINAIFRNIKILPKISNKKDLSSLSIKYSHPKYIIKKLTKQFGKEKAIEILKINNTPPKILTENIGYIQNITQSKIIEKLSIGINPKKIIDLCSSPGGKTIKLNSIFNNAKFVVNDINSKRIPRLKENLKNFNINAKIYNEDASTLNIEEKFDIVIADVPCSNSGVFNKRPEARWRKTNLKNTQLDILKNAIKLMNENGEIWYITCSIFEEENQEIISYICKNYNLQIENEIFYLQKENMDGGYGCKLKKHK